MGILRLAFSLWGGVGVFRRFSHRNTRNPIGARARRCPCSYCLKPHYIKTNNNIIIIFNNININNYNNLIIIIIYI